MFKSDLFSKMYQTEVTLQLDCLFQVPSKGHNRENYNDVQGIKFCGSSGLGKIKSFPRGLKSIFPNLVSIEVESQDISSICREDLNGLEELQILSITFCELKSLPSNLFENMRKLKVINFSDNKLENLSSDLIKPVQLSEVNFLRNTSIDARSHLGIFSVKGLMNTIDARCKKPLEDICVDKKFSATLTDKFKQFWESGCQSDFKIITKDSKEIPVHKAVLAVSSSVFSLMLQNEMKENIEGFLKIEKYDPEAVQQFFGFLYTGHIANEKHAMELFALAAIYEVLNLKLICEEIMMKNLNFSNAYDVFTLAHLYSLEDLKKKAFAMIQKRFPDGELEDALFGNPSRLKELIDAKSTKIKRIELANSVYAKDLCDAIQKMNTEVQDAEKEYKMVSENNLKKKKQRNQPLKCPDFISFCQSAQSRAQSKKFNKLK